MQENNGNNMTVTSLIGGCLTKLFRGCGSGGDGSTWDENFLNSFMAEMINVVCKSCQVLKDFDVTDPASYNQIWQAILRFGGRDGINAWAAGTTELIVTDGDCAEGCNIYVANTSGDPANNAPSASPNDWYGPFCSIGAATRKIYELSQNAGGVFTTGVVIPANGSNCIQLPPGEYYIEGQSTGGGSTNTDWFTVNIVDNYDVDIVVDQISSVNAGNGTVCYIGGNASHTITQIIQIR